MEVDTCGEFIEKNKKSDLIGIKISNLYHLICRHILGSLLIKSKMGLLFSLL